MLLYCLTVFTLSASIRDKENGMFKYIGMQQIDEVKNDVREFLKDSDIMTAKFSRQLYKRYGYSFSAIARVVSEVRKEVSI
jgi:hypothetical protein